MERHWHHPPLGIIMATWQDIRAVFDKLIAQFANVNGDIDIDLYDQIDLIDKIGIFKRESVTKTNFTRRV